MSANPNDFAISAIATVVVILGLGPKEEVSYNGEYFLKSTTWIGQVVKLEECYIYGAFADEPERYYCVEILAPEND